MSVQTARIETRIPARLDRLPWARFHWMIVVGLGTVWILDGLEVTIVGSLASRLTEKGSGISLSAAQIGTAAAAYVAGACLGALLFGQLTDRFGRKKLFMLTLGLYILATVSTAGAFNAWYFYAARFFTGAGIGGEYAAINSAIDELIPARVRGRVDLMINGSFWVGSIIGSAAAIVLLNESILPANVGWRLAFVLGAVLGIGVLIVRRHVPESPRWLFIHGREEEAERIVDDIERAIEGEVGPLPEPETSMAVRQRRSIPFRTIAATAFRLYPKRACLGLALFIGQAFLYNGVTFNLGTLFTAFYNVSSSNVPVFVIVFALGNFLGPLVLGRLFDTVGRKPMISGTYLGSAVVAVVMAILFARGTLGSPWAMELLVFATFFLASAGASAAYLTVSEIFPMETRALAIAFFYAVGTAVGGISGPLLFGRLIDTGNRTDVAVGFLIGAVVMAVGGIAEILLGVRAEGRALEDIAQPLTAADAEEAGAEETAPAPVPAGTAAEEAEHRQSALGWRSRAEQARAQAAEYRAVAHERRAAGGTPAGDGDGRPAEEVLADIAEERALGMEQYAAREDERHAAERAGDEAEREAALARARAAEERARAHEARIEALSAEHDTEADGHEALAEAARERARAQEQRSLAWEARRELEGAPSPGARVLQARADLHDRWAAMHDERALVHDARAARDEPAAAAHEREARSREELALAAEERVREAEHAAAAEEIHGEEEHVALTGRRSQEEADRRRRDQEVESRIRERIARREARERQGLRRYRPGPGAGYGFYSPGMLGTAGTVRREDAERELDREIDVIGRAVDEHGPTERDELARLVGARYWGPGRFRNALAEAAEEGRVRRVSRSTYAPPDGDRRGRQDERSDSETAAQR